MPGSTRSATPPAARFSRGCSRDRCRSARSPVITAPAARAFHVFPAVFDTWWPRTHHIGKLPMRRAIIEGRVGGRCYAEQIDGSECDWGQVLVWDPPQRFVVAWQINTEWQY